MFAELRQWLEATISQRLPEMSASWTTMLEPLAARHWDDRPFADPKYWNVIIVEGDAGPLALGATNR